MALEGAADESDAFLHAEPAEIRAVLCAMGYIRNRETDAVVRDRQQEGVGTTLERDRG